MPTKRKQRRKLTIAPRRFYDFDPRKHPLSRQVILGSGCFYETMKGEPDYEDATYEMSFSTIP